MQHRRERDVKERCSIDANELINAIKRVVDTGESIDAVDHQCYTSVSMQMKHINAVKRVDAIGIVNV